jgi:hypothetical protein
MKHNYNTILYIIIIITLAILMLLFNKYYDKCYETYVNKYLSNSIDLKEGFVWSRDTVKKFNVYQNTVNLNNNQFNMEVVQEQASEDEAKEMMKTSYWPWSEDTKKQYVEAVWSNPIIKFQPEAALDYAMKLYNETAAKRLLSWNTKEGQFLLYGGTNDADNSSENDRITVTGTKNIIKCSDDRHPVLQKKIYNDRMLWPSSTENIKNEDIPNQMPGFSFVKGPCNPCSVLNDNPDYSCPFQLNVKGDNETSDVWKNLWNI